MTFTPYAERKLTIKLGFSRDWTGTFIGLILKSGFRNDGFWVEAGFFKDEDLTGFGTEFYLYTPDSYW